MTHTILKLWHDQRGFICSTEAVLFGTIILIGSIVGLVTLRDHVVQELGDVGAALGNLNQSYCVQSYCSKRFDCYAPGSKFIDKADHGEEGWLDGSHNNDSPGKGPAGIHIGNERRR